MNKEATNKDYVYMPVETFTGYTPQGVQIDAYVDIGQLGISMLKVSGRNIVRLNRFRGDHSWINGNTWRKFNVGKKG